MIRNENILKFLDGALSSEEEAELLHRLSVSPEKRAVLRSFINQKAVFNQDKNAINVPYAAEQQLWARLGGMMPSTQPAPVNTVVPSAVTTPSAVTSVVSSPSMWARIFSTNAVSVGLVTLFLGFGLGYFSGNGQSTDHIVATTSQQGNSSAPTANNTSNNTGLAAGTIQKPSLNVDVTATKNKATEVIRYVTIDRNPFSTNVFVDRVPVQPLAIAEAASNAADISSSSVAQNSAVMDQRVIAAKEQATSIPTLNAQKDLGAVELRNVGMEEPIRPVFQNNQPMANVERSVLERFEFSFHESFGYQFPNTEATKNSVPIITNSSVAAHFQILPNSRALWAGLGVGTANVTRKRVFTVKDDARLQFNDERVVGEYSHVQANWIGGFLQTRIPAFGIDRGEIFLSGGYGFSDAGRMLMGELGIHYDVTKDVGFLAGVRGTRLTYDLNSDIQDMINSGKGGLVIPQGTLDANPAFNLEFSTGLFFHF